MVTRAAIPVVYQGQQFPSRNALADHLAPLVGKTRSTLITLLSRYDGDVERAVAPQRRSIIAHAVPLTLLAGIGHWIMGFVDWPLLGSLLVGSVPGIVIGVYASVHVPERLLRLVLAGMLITVALKTVV